jgi:putative holliday junction resolvase
MTWLAVDIGTKRVGVAVSRSGIVAEPLTSFQTRSATDTAREIVRLAETHEAAVLVVGLPYRADGSVGAHGEKIETLLGELAAMAPHLRVVTADEAHPSKEAERLGGRQADHDALAAVLILEQALSEHGSASIVSEHGSHS